MERPVLDNLNASVIQVGFDLLQESPVGDRMNNSINFSDGDADGILEAIDAKCRTEISKQIKRGKLAPEEYVVFDLVIKGIIPTELGSILSSNLVLWDSIRSLKYLHPRGSSVLIFPREFERV